LFLNGDKGSEAFGMLPTFLSQYWYMWMTLFVVIWLMHLFYINLQKRIFINQDNGTFNYKYLIFIPFIIGFHILGIRGGTQLRPIGVLDAANVAGVKNAPFVLNSTFSLLRTWQKKTLEEKRYYNEKEIFGCLSPIKQISTDSFNTGDKPNVIIILVESLSKEYLSFFGGTGQTPFLDSLLGESLVFSNGFANARESVQGVPAVLASLPAWMDEPFIFSRYSVNKVNSLASVLKKYGYDSSFFHGAATGSMGFHAFTSSVGFDHYYGREDYGNEAHFDGSWGIWDHLFLPYMIEQLSKTKEPFLSSVLTLNSHHPFILPKGFKVSNPSIEYPILNSIQYVDKALASFFNLAKNEKWFDNTLFIITADHTGPKTSQQKASIDDYRIPIIFYKTNKFSKGLNDAVISHADIMPSVLSLLGIKDQVFTFGRNVFDKSCDKFAINYKMGIYEYVDEHNYLYFNGEKTIGLYEWKSDKGLQKNLVNNSGKKNDILEIEEKIKKSIQSYHNSILYNKMIPDAL
jgi:phosphoglycerol transferase MdoB-like AlkP superfamily enzyme